MSDWQVGDLAVCVDDARLSPVSDAPKAGRVYRVAKLGRGPLGGLNLFMEGVPYPLGLGSKASRFRKIRPDEQEACEPEFVTLLKRSKQRVSA